MHDINYFIKIKDEINECINKNTIELFFKLDKNLDIMNIIITCFTDNVYEDLTNDDFVSVKEIMNIENYLTKKVNYKNIVLNLLTKANESSFYYNNLFTKINEIDDNVDKNYYNFSYYLHFDLNQNGDFDLEIKDSEGRILSKENLETIKNSLGEGENYD